MNYQNHQGSKCASRSFCGIYATRLAAHLNVPIQENDTLLPPSYLDYEAMERYQFHERSDPPFRYRLIFNRNRVVHITLPAPAYFNIQEKQRYFILEEEAEEYERAVETARRNEAAHQAVAAALQYNPNYYHGYYPGQDWP